MLCTDVVWGLPARARCCLGDEGDGGARTPASRGGEEAADPAWRDLAHLPSTTSVVPLATQASLYVMPWRPPPPSCRSPRRRGEQEQRRRSRHRAAPAAAATVVARGSCNRGIDSHRRPLNRVVVRHRSESSLIPCRWNLIPCDRAPSMRGGA